MIQEDVISSVVQQKEQKEDIKSDIVVLPSYRTHKIKDISEKDIGKEMKIT